VKRFVDEEAPEDKAQGGGSMQTDLAGVQHLFTSLLKSVQGREGKFATQQEECNVLLREGVADQAALERSARRVSANLRVAQTAMAEYKQVVAFDTEQQKLISTSTQKLGSIEKEVEHQLSRAAGRMNEHAQRLISVAAGAEQNQDGYAKSVQNLVQRIQEHRAMLMRRSKHFQDQVAETNKADSALLRALSNDLRYGSRQFTQLKAESELLSVQAVAKQSDHEMATQFEVHVRTFCSDEHLKRLKQMLRESQVEEGFLRKAYPAPAEA